MSLLREILFRHRHFKACRKLKAIVEANRNSYAVQDFAKRRAAAKLGCSRKMAA